jgi:hypothetical protein
MDAIKVELQPAEAVARGAGLLIVDEALLIPAHAKSIIYEGYPLEDEVLARVQAL